MYDQRESSFTVNCEKTNVPSDVFMLWAEQMNVCVTYLTTEQSEQLMRSVFLHVNIPSRAQNFRTAARHNLRSCAAAQLKENIGENVCGNVRTETKSDWGNSSVQ